MGQLLVWPRDSSNPATASYPQIATNLTQQGGADFTAFVHASHPYHIIPHDLTSNDLPIAFHNNLSSTRRKDEEADC
jgi:hypothetical protein